MTTSSQRPPAVLRMHGVSKRYGGVRALRDGRLTIEGAGEAHALVGANGSGKSTLLGILSGQVRADAGEIELAGERVTLHSPHAALARGIVMVSQEIAVAPDLTVTENMLLGHRQVRRWRGISWSATRARAVGVLQRLELDIDPDARVGSLTPDQQQLVEIARALSTEAKLVILDEPTSSLTDDQVRTLSAAVRRLTANRVSVLLVSHRFKEIFDLCRRVTVLRDGATVLTGELGDLDEAELVRAMVGSSIREEVPRSASAAATNEPPALEVRGLRDARAFEAIDLDVSRGEIVGLAGLVGSGRSEVLEAVFGARSVDAGVVRAAGRPVTAGSPRRAIAHGIGLLPPDRKTQGLVLRQSILVNLMVVSGLRRWRLGLPRPRTERAAAGELTDRLRLKFAGLDAAVGTLSGGNQQKVALGKWLAAGVDVLLLNEPTRGVDVSAKAEIHNLLREFADRGLAVLVSSSETDELVGLCDQVVVMSRGRITARLSGREANVDSISAAMGGHG